MVVGWGGGGRRSTLGHDQWTMTYNVTDEMMLGDHHGIMDEMEIIK